MIFDGRLAEDFKLSTGTWVSVGPLRSRILAEAAGLTQDVVIAGPDREFVAALIFPNVSACRQLSGDTAGTAPVSDVLAHPLVRERFHAVLEGLAARSTGSSTFVARAILLDEPPTIDSREITDKGSLNQKIVLQNREAIVDELYAETPPWRVITALPVES